MTALPLLFKHNLCAMLVWHVTGVATPTDDDRWGHIPSVQAAPTGTSWQRGNVHFSANLIFHVLCHSVPRLQQQVLTF